LRTVRPSLADIEAAAPTLSLMRSCHTAFGFVLNQTPVRGQRIDSASTALGEGEALEAGGDVALPFIVMRNDHQDALGIGLSVTEYAPGGKSADEIRGLWQWVSNKLGPAVAPDTDRVLFRATPLPGVPSMFR
jgi:chromosome partitioning protein